MPSGRRKRQVREAKQALYRRLVLAAAERVFAEKGYDDAKMDEIARESGLSLGTLYAVFAGKAQIFHALHEAADGELLRRAVERVRGRDDPLDVLRAGVRAYSEYFLEHPDFLRMHLCEGFAWGIEGAGAGSRARTQAWRAGVEMLTQAVARCIEAGVFVDGDPALFARTMIAMQQVQLAHWMETGGRREPEAVVRDMIDQVERSFRRERGVGHGR